MDKNGTGGRMDRRDEVATIIKLNYKMYLFAVALLPNLVC